MTLDQRITEALQEFDAYSRTGDDYAARGEWPEAKHYNAMARSAFARAELLKEARAVSAYVH